MRGSSMNDEEQVVIVVRDEEEKPKPRRPKTVTTSSAEPTRLERDEGGSMSPMFELLDQVVERRPAEATEAYALLFEGFTVVAMNCFEAVVPTDMVRAFWRKIWEDAPQCAAALSARLSQDGLRPRPSPAELDG
jgi:hypothetical protein